MARKSESQTPIVVRRARLDDIAVLQRLIEQSVRGLQSADYTANQVALALATVYGVDSRLIEDGTYFVAETDLSRTRKSGQPGRLTIVGCGGWSKRRTLFGGDQFASREDDLLDPARDAAKIRAFFVHPDWARRGIGSLILDECERRALEAGFRRLEMGATLTGVPFYQARGYVETGQLRAPLPDGESLAIVRMEKQF
jgi:GNAT superfamily N-acetyltransferase